MEMNHDIAELMTLLERSVSPYHCVAAACEVLDNAGFRELGLTEAFDLEKGGSYYVRIFDSSLMAFTIGGALGEHPTLRMESAHTDWPCLKLKPSPEVTQGRYGKLNVEVYGGPILNTWMDRPLSMAGKVCVQSEDAFQPRVEFLDLADPIAIIPNLAIHMNREVNSGVKTNAQVDMLPLMTILGEDAEESYLLAELASRLGCMAEEILDYELYLYNPELPMLIGAGKEMLSSPRIDNVTSVAACLSGIRAGVRENGINVIALYDNEEVGSQTKQGAMSSVTEHVLEKIVLALGYDRSAFLDMVMNGMMISMDVAHAMHPNHPEKNDIKNKILMGDGLAIKLAASQSYATDSSVVSVIEGLCREWSIPYKKFVNRSDMRGGSTLGALSSAILSMRTLDVGVPILAMHSARELMGAADQLAINKLAQRFFVQ